MHSFVHSLEKAELHLHLEGSLEAETLQALDPSLTEEEIAYRTSFTNFGGFIEAFKWAVGYLRTPDDYALAVRHLTHRLAAQGVRYAEITLGAGVVLWRKQDFAAVYDAITREAARSPVDVWWVLDAIRHFDLDHASAVLKLAIERAGDRVVAFGIGGDEQRGPTEKFHDLFQLAASHGLKLVPHAGETAGPESVWGAVRAGAHRIGHGIHAIDDPALVDYLRRNEIPLEVSVTSNVVTGAVASLAEHPLRRLYDAGVPIILNTDDPALFRTSLTREYEIAARHFGFSEAELAGLAANSLRYAFRYRT